MIKNAVLTRIPLFFFASRAKNILIPPIDRIIPRKNVFLRGMIPILILSTALSSDLFADSNVAGQAGVTPPEQAVRSNSSVPAFSTDNPNLAFRALVSADSQHNSNYSAECAVDGKIPKKLGGNDARAAWCIDRITAQGKAEFVLEWEKPVAVSTVVYYGRTGAGQLEECFKDYEIFLDDSQKPILRGSFEKKHGPQFAEFPLSPVQKIRIRFLNGWKGGFCHGASEIAVFARHPSERDLKKEITPALAIQAPKGAFDSFREAGLPEEIIFTTRKPSFDGHWYANIGYYADNSCRYPYPIGSGGGLYAYNTVTHNVRTILEDPNGNIRDPQVHYDGKRILFSWLPAGKHHYSLFVINSDGSGLRQLTGTGEDAPGDLPKDLGSSGSKEFRTSAAPLGDARDFAPPGWDDYEPTWLPDDSIIFCSTRAKRYVGCWQTHVGTLYKCDSNGKNIRALSCNVEQDNTPWVLANGQIIYMRWEYVDRSQVDYHHLWTMAPDGTRQMVFYGNQRPGIVMLAPKPIPDSGKIVCTFSPGHGRKEHYGVITLVDPRLGPDEIKSVKSISRNTNHSDPWPFDENHFMTASKEQIILLDGRGRELPLYRLTDQQIKEGFWINEPRPLVPRDREPVLADQTDPNSSEGTLALLNVYHGRQMGSVKPGTIKELLVYETLPKPIHYTGGTEMMSMHGTFMLERLLGSVPVNADGSAYFRLPANRPVLFLAMDEKGHCVKRMHSFTSVMPGENTTCIGCHEDRTESPRSDERNRLLKLMKTSPAVITKIPDVPDVFCFTRDIQPIFDKYCLECHNPDREEGGFNISGHWSPLYTISYAHLNWRQLLGDNRNRAQSNFPPYQIGTGASRLVKLIEEKHAGVTMPEKDQRIIRLWIDAGANFAGTYASDASGGVGYYMGGNEPVRNEASWPETKAMQSAITRRCDICHTPIDLTKKFGTYSIRQDNYSLRNPRDEIDTFIPHDLAQGNGRFSRLEIFDLSYPDQSKAVRAPLAKSAGGLGICQMKSGKPVFTDKNDPDYKTILAGIERGRRYILEEDNRFSMITPSANNGKDCPQKFVPRWSYLREMIRYGILPLDTDPRASYDPYELDQKYWQSLWYHTTGSRQKNAL